MVNLEVRTLQSGGSLTIEDKPLGKGGEGSVYNVISHSVSGLLPAGELVVKIYHKPEDGNRREKVISMVSSPPDSDMFAWPLAVAAQNGRFVGYVMEKLKVDRMKEWAHLAHTQTRRQIAPEFNVRYAIAACLNLAIAAQSSHNAGHRLGDVLNESNTAIASDASIILLDTDSAQIRNKAGKIFRCEVGKPEYTAAELIGKPLRDQDRTEASDAFAFGVLFFQMLTGGAHPTDGIYSGNDDPPSTISKISQGILPMLRDETARGYKPVPRIAAIGIPSKIKGLLLALADKNPSSRPSFEKIIAVIEEVQDNLQVCDKDSAHWFDSRDGSCGWCKHADSGQVDPWGKPRASTQSRLPPVNFGSQSAPTGKAPRAAIAPAQHKSGYAQTAVQQSFQQSNPAPNRQPSRQSSHSNTNQQPSSNSQLSQNGALSPQAQQLLNQANGQQTQSHQQQAPSQNAPEPKKQIPEKIRGKMTVIYPDGSYGPRPPLGVLLNQNPRLWRQAIAAEWPDFLKIWWPQDRPVARTFAILLSPLLAIALLITVSWAADRFIFTQTIDNNLHMVAPLLMLGELCSAVAFMIWWINCWVGRVRAKKDYGSLMNVKHENALLTMFRAFGIVIGYIFTPIIVGIAILIVLIKTMIRGDRQVRSRW